MKYPTEPLISCIIPTKNRPELLLRAVRSVIEQTYQKIEVIVIDDSTDSLTQQTLRQSPLPVRYIKNEQSKGASYSRNIGLLEAKGDIISFLDDDDSWMPEKIATQLKLIKHYPIVSCNCIAISDGRKSYISFPNFVKYRELLYYNFIGSCSFVIIDRNIMKGCYFDEKLKCGQDWDMWLSIMNKNHIAEAANIGEFLVYYNQGQHSRITNTAERIPEVISIYEKYKDQPDVFTNEMFGLYYIISAEDSHLLRLLRGLAIARRKNKGLIFVIKTLVQRLFGRVVIY